MDGTSINYHSHRGRQVELNVMNIINKKIELSDGRIIEIETGKLAKQADGAVVVKMGGTMLLAAVTCAKDAKEDVDFMPLQVDYKEKFAAAGRFPGGFMKREGKASDYEILVARLVDRALRPLFPEDFHAEVYVTVNLISAEKDIQPDALAGLAASAALAVSDIPFEGPISEVRVARIDGQLKINPNFSEMEKADIDIMVAATYDNIMMVEGEMNEVSEHCWWNAACAYIRKTSRNCFERTARQPEKPNGNQIRKFNGVRTGCGRCFCTPCRLGKSLKKPQNGA